MQKGLKTYHIYLVYKYLIFLAYSSAIYLPEWPYDEPGNIKKGL